MNYPYENLPGQLDWRNALFACRRDWNEGEVAAVLWDIFDPPSWEYLPAAKITTPAARIAGSAALV